MPPGDQTCRLRRQKLPRVEMFTRNPSCMTYLLELTLEAGRDKQKHIVKSTKSQIIQDYIQIVDYLDVDDSIVD